MRIAACAEAPDDEGIAHLGEGIGWRRVGDNLATQARKIALVLLQFNQEYIVKNTLKPLAKSAKIKFNTPPGAAPES